MSKFDMIVFSRPGTNPNVQLLKTLERMPDAHVIVWKESPLSLARKHAVTAATTEWVGMVDGDFLLPLNWLETVSSGIGPRVGAVATVERQGNRHIAAYNRVVGQTVKLNKVDTAAHIGNVLVRRKLYLSYVPPPLFYGEDLRFKRHVEKSGYEWKVLPGIGAVHLGSSKNYYAVGLSYRRDRHYTPFQLARRTVAQFLFIPFAALANRSSETFVYLNRINVQFMAGWLTG
jgi:hypothetical protein